MLLLVLVATAFGSPQPAVDSSVDAPALDIANSMDVAADVPLAFDDAMDTVLSPEANPSPDAAKLDAWRAT